MARRRGRSSSRRFARGNKQYVWTATRFINELHPFVGAPTAEYVPEGLLLVTDAMWERTAGFEKCILERLIISYIWVTGGSAATYAVSNIPRLDWAIFKTDEDAPQPIDPHLPDFLVEEDILQFGHMRPHQQWGSTPANLMNVAPSRQGREDIDINVKRKLDSSEAIVFAHHPKDMADTLGTSLVTSRFSLTCRALVRLI